MAASSNINIQLIDNTFPIPNKSQSSQGFRTNWLAIQDNFTFVKSDILNLQSKTLTVSGDISGVSPIFDSGSTTIDLSVTLEPTGLEDLQPGTYVTDLTNNISFTIDNRGLVTEIKETTANTVLPSSGKITPVSSLDKSNLYSGTTSINIPSISYNEYGQITGITDNIINGFGITDLYMPKNSILYGTNLKQSAFLSPPANNSTLYYNEDLDSLEWVSSLAVSEFSSGTLISATYNNSTNIVDISVDYSKAQTTTNIDSSALICIYDGQNYNLTKLSTIESNITSNVSSNIKIINDKTPQLGADLDTNGFKIVDNTTNNVTLSSQTITLSSTKPVNINGVLMPVSLPTEDSLLFLLTDGTVSYKGVGNYDTTFLNNLVGYNLSNNQIVTLDTSTSLNYMLISDNITSVSMLVDSLNYNSNTQYNLKYSVYMEISNSDLTMNFSSQNSNTMFLSGNGPFTNLTFDQGYIYKIELEYYSNSKWIVTVPFKASLT